MQDIIPDVYTCPELLLLLGLTAGHRFRAVLVRIETKILTLIKCGLIDTGMPALEHYQSEK